MARVIQCLRETSTASQPFDPRKMAVDRVKEMDRACCHDSSSESQYRKRMDNEITRFIHSVRGQIPIPTPQPPQGPDPMDPSRMAQIMIAYLPQLRTFRGNANSEFGRPIDHFCVQFTTGGTGRRNRADSSLLQPAVCANSGIDRKTISGENRDATFTTSTSSSTITTADNDGGGGAGECGGGRGGDDNGIEGREGIAD
jgi:hypothetical protein